MRGITNTNVVNSVRDALERMSTEHGLEVSDDRFYRVSVSWTQIEDSDMFAFVTDFPPEVVGCSPETAMLTVKAFNKTDCDYKLHLSSSAYGLNLKYQGVPDYPHFRHVYVVRIFRKED